MLSLPDFHYSMREADSLEEQVTLLKLMLRQYGYNEFVFGVVPSFQLQNAHQLFAVDNVDKKFREKYDEEGYARYDIALLHCLENSDPILWSTINQIEETETLEPQYIKLAELVREYGYTNGVTIPLFTDWNPFRFGMSLIRRNDTDYQKHDVEFEKNKSALLLTCQIFFQTIKFHGAVIERFGITETELTLLRKIATGQSREAIAKAENLHTNSVKYKLKKIYNKLGAQNAEQALVIYCSLGLHKFGS